MDALRLHLHSIIPPKPFFRMFTRPFRRKSVPSSPALPPKTYRSSSEGPADTVTVLALPKRRLRVLKRRLRNRVDIYVHCRVPSKNVFRRRRKNRSVVSSCPNSVVSATNQRPATSLEHGMNLVGCMKLMSLTTSHRKMKWSTLPICQS